LVMWLHKLPDLIVRKNTLSFLLHIGSPLK
jgi:hypothetical protein